MRAATPGTILVFAACVLLVLVTVSTPVIKSITFLNATIGGSGSEGGESASLGCLGYCINNTCSSPSIGYSFDPNQLLNIKLISSKYTSTVIKGLTYALVLHPVALAFGVLAFIMGIVAHCSVVCCLDVIFANLAAGITLIAFGLDCALFIIAKKRIEDINGASASLGTALWMTLAAFILMSIGSCALTCGCCSSRKRDKRVKDDFDNSWKNGNGGRGGESYGERMRMEAMDAERDRKWRQKEADLPKFAEYETEHVESVPLKSADYDEQAYASAGNGYGYPEHGSAYHDPYGEHHQHGADPYGGGPASFLHHDPYGGGNAGYAPGVGPGMPRQNHQYEPSWQQQQQQQQNYPESYHNEAAYGMAGAAAGAAAMSGARRQPTNEYSSYHDAPSNDPMGGHAVDYSGQTFGGQAAGGSRTGGYSDVGHASSVHDDYAGPHRAYSQSVAGQSRTPSRAGSSRNLPPPMPNMPASYSSNSNAQPAAIPYLSPTSPTGPRLSGRDPSIDDGFGLAVLQAGEAQKQIQNRQYVSSPPPSTQQAERDEADGYHAQSGQPQQSSQLYKNEKQMVKEHYAQQEQQQGPSSSASNGSHAASRSFSRSRPLPSAPGPNDTYQRGNMSEYEDSFRPDTRDGEEAPPYHPSAHMDPATGASQRQGGDDYYSHAY